MRAAFSTASVFLGVLGEVLGALNEIRGTLGLERRHSGIALALTPLVVLGVLLLLRGAHLEASPETYLYLELTGTFLSFCYAANALVRFRGTHDRIALILAFGFVISGVVETVVYFGLRGLLEHGLLTVTHVPMGWMVGRTLLGILLLAAIGVERRLPTARQPSREIAGAMLVVAAVSYITSAAFLAAPAAPTVHPTRFLSRPWDLLPAGLFLMAAFFFRRRLRFTASIFDHALVWMAVLNAGCHLVACFSERLFDGPFVLAEVLKTTSYAVILAGALLDNARLFDEIRRLAVSDPLTGLANYRRLISILESEIDRSKRTGRPFSVVLFDMDGLKTINDRYGHLVGSRALCRLANVLRSNCRTIDTAARYGGDEFALVLPEAGPEIAERVVARISDRLTQDGERPFLSASAGAAVYPRDGDSVEKLLGAADRALYRMKAGSGGVKSFARIAACL